MINTRKSSNNWSTASNASTIENNETNTWNTKINIQKFLLRIPKADLHIHLDGSIRIETLIDLAQQYNVDLPSYDAQELKDLVFKEKYNSLEEYLRGFGYIIKVLTTHEALERVAYEVTMDCYHLGVRHVEIRFAPQMHAIPGKFSIEQVLCAVNKGMERAAREADELDELSRYLSNRCDDDDDESMDISQQLDEETMEKVQYLKNKQGMHPYHPDAPPHQYGIIACAMRFFLPAFSPYYEAFCEVHKGEDLHRVFGLASVALVTAVNNLRRKGKCCHDCDCEECPACSSSDPSDIISSDNDGLHGYILPIVALDIAGAEVGYPASDHREAFDLAHQSFLHKTVHAGEAYGPESIMEAVTDLHAERIGHGCNLFKWDIIGEGEGRGGKSSSNNKNRIEMTDSQKQQYCENLTRYLGTMRLCMEVCLSSNLQTIPELDGDLRKHPAKKMIEEGLAVALCTDNTLVSRTDIVREISLAVEAFQLTPSQLRDIVFNGFKRSFMAKRYSAKREYNRRVISYYKKIEIELGLGGYGSEYGE
ncbi:hypothetical protein ACHAWT_005886 [Skeletonema menzelii]|eukprot:scaffold3792_cov160-Skeletonema_menzelii.AAC.20